MIPGTPKYVYIHTDCEKAFFVMNIAIVTIAYSQLAPGPAFKVVCVIPVLQHTCQALQAEAQQNLPCQQ